MKTILVPTDFSKGAVHAAETAVWFAEKIQSRVLLWNCSPKVPVMPGYMGGTFLAQTAGGSTDCQDNFERIKGKLEDFITGAGGAYMPQVNTRHSEGGFREELTKLLDENTFELIVIGAPAGCAVEHIFTGSHTLATIEAANCPVLIVPSRATVYQINKLVFATDYETKDVYALRYLAALSQKLGFEIEIVHVTINGKAEQNTLARQEEDFKKKLTVLNGIPVSIKEIRGKDVVGRLNRVSKQTSADILAMSHHHYSFFKRLFTQSTVEKALSHQKTPLLVIPLVNERRGQMT